MLHIVLSGSLIVRFLSPFDLDDLLSILLHLISPWTFTIEHRRAVPRPQCHLCTWHRTPCNDLVNLLRFECHCSSNTTLHGPLLAVPPPVHIDVDSNTISEAAHIPVRLFTFPTLAHFRASKTYLIQSHHCVYAPPRLASSKDRQLWHFLLFIFVCFRPCSTV